MIALRGTSLGRMAVAALAAICLMSLASAPSAGAAEVSIRSCSLDRSATLNWTIANPGWFPTLPNIPLTGKTAGSCFDRGMSFDTSAPAPEGTKISWNFHFDQVRSITHIKFDYEGGETSTGWRYSVLDCPSDCTTIDTLPLRGAAAPPTTFENDVSKPWQLVVRATCTQATCAKAVPLAFHDFVSTVRDDDPPKPTVLITHGNWMKAREMKTGVWLDDGVGLGLSAYSARVDNMAPFLYNGACDLSTRFQGAPFYSAEIPCAQRVALQYSPMDMNGIPDGVHDIIVDARDSVGNVMPTSKTRFKIDDTAPDAPKDVRVDTVTNGFWTTKPEVAFSWNNLGEDGPTLLQSGVAYPKYVRKPAEGYDSDQITVEGHYLGNSPTSIPHAQLPVDGKYDFFISLVDWADNAGGSTKVTVGRDTGVLATPKLDASGWMNQDTLNEFKQPVDQQPGTAISGVCGFGELVNSTENSDPPGKITQAGAIDHLTVDPGLPNGRNWLHVTAISCAGTPSPTGHTELKIDRPPPTTFVDGMPGSGWTNKPITAVVGAEDGLSGVWRVSYRIDDAQLLHAAAQRLSVQMPQGHHFLTFSATDIAHNTAPEKTYETRFDATAPAVAIAPFDPAHPTHLNGTVSDQLSGAANAVFEYRRLDGGGWTSLPTATQPDAVGAATMAVEATIPDAALADGDYEFRLRASDIAGNAAATAPSLQLTFPIRAQPTLSARLATFAKCKTKVGCNAKKKRLKSTDARAARTIRYGAPVSLIGELLDQKGDPITGRELKIYAAEGGVNPQFVGAVTTDSSGAYQFNPKQGPSRRFTVRYEGTTNQLPASASADLGVTVGAALSVSKQRVHNGESIRLTGHVLGVSAEHSATGLRVLIKYFKRGSGWRPALDDPVVDADGRFVTDDYKFQGELTAAKTVKFKAFVNTRRTGFPFVEGYSNVVKVRVLP
jgi:hypothetical protein